MNTKEYVHRALIAGAIGVIAALTVLYTRVLANTLLVLFTGLLLAVFLNGLAGLLRDRIRVSHGAAVALAVRDFMPVLEWSRQLSSHQEIHRILTTEDAPVTVDVVLRPRFDTPAVRPTFDAGPTASSSPTATTMRSPSRVYEVRNGRSPRTWGRPGAGSSSRRASAAR